MKVKIGKNSSNPTFGEIDTCDISKVLDLQKSIIGKAYTVKVYMWLSGKGVLALEGKKMSW